MGGQLIERKRQNAEVTSHNASLKISRKTLWISSLSYTFSKSIAPIRRIIQRRKIPWYSEVSNIPLNLAKDKRNVFVAAESRPIKLGLMSQKFGAVIKGRRGIDAVRRKRLRAIGGAGVFRVAPTASNTYSKGRTNSLLIGEGRRNVPLVKRFKVLSQGMKYLGLRQNIHTQVKLSSSHDTRPQFVTIETATPLIYAKEQNRNQKKLINWQKQAYYMETAGKKKLTGNEYRSIKYNLSQNRHSVAPKLSKRDEKNLNSHHNRLENHANLEAIPENNLSKNSLNYSNVELNKLNIGQVVREVLTSDVRRPPAGVAAFDARSAPIWPGRKPAF